MIYIAICSTVVSHQLYNKHFLSIPISQVITVECIHPSNHILFSDHVTIIMTLALQR